MASPKCSRPTDVAYLLAIRPSRHLMIFGETTGRAEGAREPHLVVELDLDWSSGNRFVPAGYGFVPGFLDYFVVGVVVNRAAPWSCALESRARARDVERQRLQVPLDACRAAAVEPDPGVRGDDVAGEGDALAGKVHRVRPIVGGVAEAVHEQRLPPCLGVGGEGVPGLRRDPRCDPRVAREGASIWPEQKLVAPAVDARRIACPPVNGWARGRGDLPALDAWSAIVVDDRRRLVRPCAPVALFRVPEVVIVDV